MEHFKQIIQNNKNLVVNVCSSFLIRGAGMLLSLLSLPLYLRFFDNNQVLGLWFTILSVLNWVLSFDLGIGNGLRNHLTEALVIKDFNKCKQLISSAYCMLGVISLIIYVLCISLSGFVNWNGFFNIDNSVISSQSLHTNVIIIFTGIIVSFLLRIVNSIIYALQKPAVNNAIHLLTSVLIVVFLLVASTGTIEQNLRSMSMAYAIIINVPLVITTICVFYKTRLKECKPNFSYVTRDAGMSVLSLGVMFLLLQIMYMVITVTNEWFIGHFYDPKYCVDYQVYFRLFSIFSSVFSLALIPLWSAITAAKASKNFSWIIKLTHLLYVLVGVFALVQIAVLPFMQQIVDFWLKDNAMKITNTTSVWFCIYSIMFLWIAVQSTIVNGLGSLKLQLIGYSFAMIFKVAFVLLFAAFSTNWIIVLIGTIIGLLPYCILQPIYIKKELRAMCVE